VKYTEFYVQVSSVQPSFLAVWVPVSVRQFSAGIYEGWNFNSGNYLFTTDTK